MKKLLAVLLIATMCLGLCSCGKEYDQAMELLELVEDHRYYEAHELLNEMAGEGETPWAPDYSYQWNDSDDMIDDSWVYDDSCSDPCGDIGSGSDFWNGDNTTVEDTQPSVPEEPKEIPIEGIKMSQTELNLKTLDKAALTASVYPENTTEYPETITWTSSDETVVTVYAWNGEMKAVGCGTATITATMGEHTATCSVTVSNPTIATVEDLLAIENFQSNVVYELVADIDMQGIEEPERKPSVYGILEGNGHKIYNLGYGPLFYDVSSGGVVRNLTIECDVTVVNQEENASIDFAVLSGNNSGLIERCTTRGNVNLAVDYVNAGGITVTSHGSVYQCVNEVNFTFGGTIINPLGVERKSALVYAGGIVCRGNVSECYNIGNATFLSGTTDKFGGIAYEPHTIENCYNLGMSNSKYSAGISADCFGELRNCVNYGSMNSGITGGHHAGYIIDCYYLKSKSPEGATREGYGDGVEENNDRARAYGLSDSAALLQESYGALDFENVWVMGPDGYPILKWQTEQ